MRVFVTGATGMLGRALVTKLVERGDRVRALVRQPAPLPRSVERVAGSLDDVDVLASAMRGCDAVFHVAGLVSYRPEDAAALYRTNTLGTRSVMTAALQAGVGRVVHTSSTAAVGFSDEPRLLDEEAPFDARLRRIPYSWTKRLAETEVREAVACGLDAVIVNPSTIVGAGDVNLNSGRVFLRLAQGSFMAAPPGGNAVIAVDDAVRGLLLALERGRPGERYILSAENLTHRDMLSRIAIAAGRGAIRHELPRWTEWPARLAAHLTSPFGGAVPPDVVRFSYRFRWFDAARSRAVLGWKPEVPFERAAADAHAYYRARSPALALRPAVAS